MTHALGALACLAALMAAGCGGGSETPAATAPKGCEKAAPVHPASLPNGFPRPAGLVAASVSDRGSLVEVHGFVPLEPGAAVRALLRSRGVEKIDSEDDGPDAEGEFRLAGRRYSFKFVRACKGGSVFTAQRAAEPGE